MLIQVFLSFFLFSYQQVAPGACGEDRQRPRRLPRALQRIPREVRRMDTDTEPPDPTVWAQAIRTQRREVVLRRLTQMRIFHSCTWLWCGKNSAERPVEKWEAVVLNGLLADRE